MKVIKVVEVVKLYSVMFDKTMNSETGARINKSLSIVEIHDHNTNKTHFSEWHGVTNTLDLLPNGSLYLDDNFDEAIKRMEERYSYFDK